MQAKIKRDLKSGKRRKFEAIYRKINKIANDKQAKDKTQQVEQEKVDCDALYGSDDEESSEGEGED